MLRRHNSVIEETMHVPADGRGRAPNLYGYPRLRDPRVRPDECEDGACRRAVEVDEDTLFDHPVPSTILEVPGCPALPHDGDLVERLEQVEVVPECLSVHYDHLGDRREIDPRVRDDSIVDRRPSGVFEKVLPIDPALAGEAVLLYSTRTPEGLPRVPDSGTGIRHRTGTMCRRRSGLG